MRYALLAAIVAVAFGCSNPETSKSNGGSDAGSNDPNNATNNANNGGSNNATNNVNNASDMGGADDMSSSGPCPPEPATTDSCDIPGLECEYGGDPREGCRTVATCTDGTWSVAVPDCEALPTTMCPMTREDASGMDCEPMDAYCTYGGLVCQCTNCTLGGPVEMCGGDPTWKCDVPNADPDCPDGKPRLGAGCDEDGKQCEYECGPNGARVCEDGAWQRAEGGPCPVSTARVKRDVRYLSAEELADVSSALQRIPLARYEYTDPALGRGEKLGFIIEDLPEGTPAVHRERMMVDLYGYTSMLVADAQAREKRMQALEARLAELEAKASSCAE